MRRVLIALTAMLVLSLALSAGAQARCSVACLNHRVQQLSNGLIRAEKKIAALNRTVSQQAQTIAGLGEVGKKVDALYACLFEVPVTQYGEPEEEGYLYENATETFKTTALDVPFKGEPVGAWFLIDGCNPLETAGLRSARALAPAANLGALLAPQRRLFP
jgi:hypothetical protein